MIIILNLVGVFVSIVVDSSLLFTFVSSIPSSEQRTATHDVFQDLNAFTKSCLSLASVGRGGAPPVPFNIALAAVGSIGSSY